MKSKEKSYIKMRKRKAFRESLAYYACRIFPIQQNKIVMWTFEGNGGYGCNPKYIAEELLRRNKEENKNYKIYWILKDTSKNFPKEIVKVKDTLWNRAYHFATSKVWVGNTRTFYGTKKRKKQIYIQTWHATLGFKATGKNRKEKLPKIAEIVSEADSNLITYVIAGSQFCKDVYPNGLIYNGDIKMTGTPRCDVLYNDAKLMRQKYRRKYGLSEDAKIMLYAPTFRGGSQKGNRSVSTEVSTVDFKGMIASLEERFGGTWYVFLRLHPQLAAIMKGVETGENSERMIDVSQLPDMNEIIAASDAFLTDYSSAIFEGAMMGMPAFLYVDDIKEYVADRGDFLYDIFQLPFPIALNNDELQDKIKRFDENKYKNEVKALLQANGNIEDGNASKNVVNLIENTIAE